MFWSDDFFFDGDNFLESNKFEMQRQFLTVKNRAATSDGDESFYSDKSHSRRCFFEGSD